MALSYSKPTKRPDWGDTSTNITEPSSGFKDAGWLTNADHVSSYENWKANTISDWFKWFDERFTDGATKDDFKVLAALEVDASGHASSTVNAITSTGKGSNGLAISASGWTATGTNNGGSAIYGLGGNASTSGTGGTGIRGVGGLGAGSSNSAPGGVFNGGDSNGTGDGGDGVQSSGGSGASSAGIPGRGGEFTGGNAWPGTNVNGGTALETYSGSGDGTGYNGPGIIGVGYFSSSFVPPFTTTVIEAGAGIVGQAGFVVGTSGAGGTGGIFYGKVATGTNQDGGFGVRGVGAAGIGTGKSGAGVVGLGDTSVTLISADYGEKGVLGIGATGEYGGRFRGGVGADGIYCIGTSPSSGAGTEGGQFQGSNSVTTGNAGYGLKGVGGNAGSGTNGSGGVGVWGLGGILNGTGYNGPGVVGLGTGSTFSSSASNDGAGVVGIGSSSDGLGGRFTAGGNRAAIQLVPLDADPSTAAAGDLITTSASHPDGLGYLKIYTGAAWVKVGTQT
jgi:hypothetical protein